MSAASLAVRLRQGVETFVRARNPNLGHLESRLAQEIRELLRQAAEAGAQQKADATPPQFPVCHHLHEHAARMDYRAGRRRGEPIGSGAVEATCHLAASTSVASNVRVNSGAASATGRYSAWKPSGATAAGTCSSLNAQPFDAAEN